MSEDDDYLDDLEDNNKTSIHSYLIYALIIIVVSFLVVNYIAGTINDNSKCNSICNFFANGTMMEISKGFCYCEHIDANYHLTYSKIPMGDFKEGMKNQTD